MGLHVVCGDCGVAFPNFEVMLRHLCPVKFGRQNRDDWPAFDRDSLATGV